MRVADSRLIAGLPCILIQIAGKGNFRNVVFGVRELPPRHQPINHGELGAQEQVGAVHFVQRAQRVTIGFVADVVGEEGDRNRAVHEALRAAVGAPGRLAVIVEGNTATGLAVQERPAIEIGEAVARRHRQRLQQQALDQRRLAG